MGLKRNRRLNEKKDTTSTSILCYSKNIPKERENWSGVYSYAYLDSHWIVFTGVWELSPGEIFYDIF